MQEVTQLNVVFQQPPKLTTPQPPPYDRVSFNEFSFIAHAGILFFTLLCN